jgi:hypothetical protein
MGPPAETIGAESVVARCALAGAVTGATKPPAGLALTPLEDGDCGAAAALPLPAAAAPPPEELPVPPPPEPPDADELDAVGGGAGIGFTVGAVVSPERIGPETSTVTEVWTLVDTELFGVDAAAEDVVAAFDAVPACRFELSLALSIRSRQSLRDGYSALAGSPVASLEGLAAFAAVARWPATSHKSWETLVDGGSTTRVEQFMPPGKSRDSRCSG